MNHRTMQKMETDDLFSNRSQLESVSDNFHSNLNIGSTELEMCQCCLSAKNLKNITSSYDHCGRDEVYSRMLSFAFIDFKCENGYICTDCIERLRAVVDFKNSVESAQRYLQSQKLRKIEDLDKSNIHTDHLESIQEDSNDLHSSEYSSDDEDIPLNKLNDIKEESETSEDNIADFFETMKKPTPKLFPKKDLDIGEQKTLPYVLGNTDRKCEICHKEFGFFKELLNHMHEHYPNHICDICGKICATRKTLIFHTKTHSDTRKKCDFCDKSFKNKSNLNAHVKVQHKGEKILFKCSQCGEQLNTYNARIKHMAEKHGREDKAYKCTQCSCKYRLSSHLRAHIRRVHLQEKKHKCQDCGSSYFTRSDLEKHISKMCHASTDDLKLRENQQFLCKWCTRLFDNIEEIREHIKSHGETKCNLIGIVNVKSS